MQKLLLLLILSIFPPQILSVTILVPTNQQGVFTNITVGGGNNSEVSSYQSVNDINAQYERSHKFNQPRITQAFCNKDSDKKQSNIERNSTREYWSTYLGGIVNHQSLKEFFSITASQYSSNCDEWSSTYVNLPFHKVLVFAYERNIIDITGYWAISLSTLSRAEAKRFGLEACENSHRINKMESFTCSILFGNNDIVNKDYLALAKMSEDEYIKAITNYVNQASEVTPSQSELGDFFK